ARAHRATRGPSDVIEPPAQGGERGRRPAAGVSPRRVVTGGRPSADVGVGGTGAARTRRVTYAHGRHSGEDITWPLAPLSRGSRWIRIGNPGVDDDASLRRSLRNLLDVVGFSRRTPALLDAVRRALAST